MRTKRKKAGFSLVEVAISALVISILTLTIGAVLYSSWRNWQYGAAAVQLQRDSTIIFRTIAKEVRSSSIGTITAGDILACPGGIFTRSGSSLQFDSFRLADDYVTDFSSTIDTNAESVTVTLSMRTELADSTVCATFFLRN